MKKTALRLSTLALGLSLTGMIAPSGFAVEATTDPVGYYTLPINPTTDNVMSLPMVRDAVFSGTVDTTTPATASTFRAKAGSILTPFAGKNYAYTPSVAGQEATTGLTYYVEFTGAATDAATVNTLRGLYYRIVSNTDDTLTLAMDGDSLLSHSLLTPAGGSVTATIAAGDSFKIRPYWRMRDVLQNGNTPIIEPRTNVGILKDDVLFPNYTATGINKAPGETFFFLNAAGNIGWRKVAGPSAEDHGDRIMQPNEAFIVRRRNTNPTAITNLGGVLMNRSISFVAGGDGSKGNDIYISLNRPAAVSLDNSGLRSSNQTLSLIKDSNSPGFVNGDQLLAFSDGIGYNRAPNKTYFFVQNQPAGQGWRVVGDTGNLTIGATVMLEPGKVYILRKAAASAGRDWLNEANY